MQASAFSRPILVKEWPARHCFISIPRPWVHLVHHGETPTFCLEVLSGKRVLLSWAGDVHLPNVDEENSIMIGREVMKGSDIEDGEMGILTQVSVPPSCSSISVTVRTLNQWQDLALNVDSAQSAILSQMRVMTLGQTLPLWLDGGVCIMLTVTSIDPPMNSVVLHPMTQVEVHPPSENEKSEEFTHISFNPSSVNADVADEDEVTIQDEGSCIETDNKNQMGTSEIYNEIMLRKLVDFMADKLERQKRMKSVSLRRNICRGYRVLPFPSDISSPLCSILQSHPSLVIISKESIVQSAYSDQATFIASVRKIKSPKENQERPTNMKEEGKASETKKKTNKLENKESGSQKLCTVIVWENFARGRIEYSSLLKDMNFIIQKNNCIISNCCRRQMNLEITCLIEIRSTDVVISTMPVSVDVAPVTNIDDSKKEKLLDSLKSLLGSLTNECTVIINPNTILEVEVSGNYIDTCLSTRNKIPLKLTKESVVILETTLLTQAPSLPYIPNSLKDLDSYFLAKYPFLGEDKIVNDLMQHILTCLGHKISSQPIVPQFALVCGSKGSGKTSLMETLVEKLTGSEHFIHCDIISFKQLKGKKMETIEKKLQLVLRESIFRRPSLVILEDLDYLVPLDETPDQESGPVHEHIMQVVSMLRKQLDDLLRFCTTCDTCSVMIIGTCGARTSVHPLLVNPQGCHYFPCTFKIPPLEPEGRVAAFLSMLRAHCQQYAATKRDKKQCNLDKDEHRPSCEPAEFHIDTKIIMTRTESFVFPDLNHLAFRTFLHARDRWENCIPNEKGSNLEENEYEYNKNALSIYRSSVEMNEDKNDANSQPWTILDSDLEAALDGYTSLALRGIALSEKKAAVGLRVGGLKEAKKILEETLTWPSVFPNLFNKVKLRLRSGVLLYGPPGSGKTLLANAVTAHCQLNFISVKGPELLSKYIGASEQAVRDAFERASSAKPCVLFFDEFESIAPRRGHDSTGVTDRVVNQLLTQMDGVEGLTGVYILAATSRPDLIDPALLRPGRLDKCVYCPMPTTNERREILEVLSQDIDIGEEIDWSQVANMTENFTGADLQSVLSTAQVLVAQESLGDDLYKGVLPPAQEADTNKNIHIVEECFSSDTEVLSNEDTAETLHFTDMGSQEQVLIEKEKRRVIYSQKSNSSEQIEPEQENNVGPHIYPNSSEEIIANSNTQLDSTTNNFKIYFRHIQAALKEVKPSVTQADQQKYAKLYASFTNSREGNFGQPSPGKRATLA